MARVIVCFVIVVESSWKVTAHGDAREANWSEYWRMEWVASTVHTTSEHGVPKIPTADAQPPLLVVDWTDAPADLKGFVHFTKGWNLVSTCAQSHFKCSLSEKDKIEKNSHKVPKTYSRIPSPFFRIYEGIRLQHSTNWFQSLLNYLTQYTPCDNHNAL